MQPAGEPVASKLTFRTPRGGPDLPEGSSDVGPESYWDLLNAADAVVPAALEAGRREDLGQRRPEAESAVAAGEERFEAADEQSPEHLGPGRTALPITELHREEVLSAILTGADDDEQAAVLGLQSRAEMDAVCPGMA